MDKNKKKKQINKISSYFKAEPPDSRKATQIEPVIISSQNQTKSPKPSDAFQNMEDEEESEDNETNLENDLDEKTSNKMSVEAVSNFVTTF